MSVIANETLSARGAEAITLTTLEELAKTLRAARDTVVDRVTTLHEEVTTLRNRKLPGIKSAVASAKEAEAKLEQAIIAAPASLFESPRTLVAHGLKFGFSKGRGKIEWADEATVIDRIEKLFPDQVKVLVKVEKSVRKKALGALKADELKRLGCTVREAGDHVYIEGVADDIEKLVNRLLKEDSAQGEE